MATVSFAQPTVAMATEAPTAAATVQPPYLMLFAAAKACPAAVALEAMVLVRAREYWAAKKVPLLQVVPSTATAALAAGIASPFVKAAAKMLCRVQSTAWGHLSVVTQVWQMSFGFLSRRLGPARQGHCCCPICNTCCNFALQATDECIQACRLQYCSRFPGQVYCTTSLMDLTHMCCTCLALHFNLTDEWANCYLFAKGHECTRSC